MSELRLWIRDVGFPAAIAFFVLLRVDATINRIGDRTTESVILMTQSLHEVVETIHGVMESQKETLNTLEICCKIRDSFPPEQEKTRK